MPPYQAMTIRGRGGALPRYNGGDSVYTAGRGVSARYDYQSDKAIRIQAQANQDALRRSNIGPALIQFGQTVNMWENNYAKTKAQDLFTQYERAMNELLEGENGLLTMKGEQAFGTPEANGIPGTACSGGSCKQVYTVGPTEETDPSTFGLPAATQAASTAALTGQPPLNPGDPDAIQQIGRARNPIPGSFGQAFFRQQNIQTGRRCVSGSCSGINNIRATRANSLRSQLLDGQYWHVRNIFNRLADDYDAKADLRVRKYQTAQFKKWQDDVDDAAMSQYLERAIANADDPEEFVDNLNKFQYYAKNKMERSGMAAPLIEENLKKLSSGAYRDAALYMIDNGNLAGAEALLNGNANYSLAYGRTEEGNIEKASGAPQDSSPVRTVTIPTEKGYTVVPTVDSNGQPVTTDGAIEQYQTSGKNYGTYTTEDAARLAARQLVMGSDVMNTKDKQRVLKALEIAKKKKQTADKGQQFQMQLAAEDQMVAMANGIEIPESQQLNESYFVAAYGSNTVTAYKKYEEYKQHIDAQQMIADNAWSPIFESRERLQKYEESHKDAHGEGVTKLVKADIDRREKELKDDPIKYFTDNNADMKVLHDAFIENPSDTNLQNAWIASVSEASRFFGTRDSGDTGIPDTLFTKSYIHDFTQQLQTAEPNAAIGQLAQFQNAVGSRIWESAWKQLSKDGGISDGVKPLLDMNLRDSEQNRAAKIQLTALRDKDWGKAADARLGLSGTTKTEFNEAIYKKLETFFNSLTTADMAMAPDYHDFVSNLSRQYMIEGMKQDEAITKAVDVAINSNYEFAQPANNGNLQVRIPRKAGVDANRVKEGMDYIKSSRIRDFIPKEDWDALQAQLHWMPEHERDSFIASEIRMVTAPDESGAMLLNQSTGEPMCGRDGLPNVISWEDLQDYGAMRHKETVMESVFNANPNTVMSADRLYNQHSYMLNDVGVTKEEFKEEAARREHAREVAARRQEQERKAEQARENEYRERKTEAGARIGEQIIRESMSDFLARYPLPEEVPTFDEFNAYMSNRLNNERWWTNSGETFDPAEAHLVLNNDELMHQLYDNMNDIAAEEISLRETRQAQEEQQRQKRQEQQRIESDARHEEAYKDLQNLWFQQYQNTYENYVRNKIEHGTSFSEATDEVRFREYFGMMTGDFMDMDNRLGFIPNNRDIDRIGKEAKQRLAADAIIERAPFQESGKDGGSVIQVSVNQTEANRMRDEIYEILGSSKSENQKFTEIRGLIDPGHFKDDEWIRDWITTNLKKKK